MSVNESTCPKCAVVYKHPSSLRRHLKASHPEVAPSAVRSNLVCTVCRGTFATKNDFRNHLIKKHDVISSLSTKIFNSRDDFLAWKSQIEKETDSFYVIARTVNDGDFKLSYYNCCRSGYYTAKGKGIRHLRTKGSRKIDGYCPSELKVKFDTHGKYTVTHFEKHWGHGVELQHLGPTAEERALIASKIAAKIPSREILYEIRRNVSNPEDFKRLDLLTIKDLNNIKASFNLSSDYMKHQCDALSVDAWVKELSQDESNCVLYYKPQGESCEEFAQLSEQDFFLAIMTNAQATMLELYGNDIVCMDGTHGMNGYDFQLVTLMVVDDVREGFPCAFLFTNRTAKDTLSIMFSKIKERLGSKMPTPRVFMSGMDDAFYNAWVEAMKVLPENRLFCIWHIDKAWRNQLKAYVQTMEKSTEVYKIVRSLMEETNKTTFDQALNAAVQKLLGDPQTRAFGEYFEAHYARDPTVWAYCHRLHLGVNTNMYVESLHKCLKYFQLDGETTKRLDKGLLGVIRFLNNKIFDRIITINKGKISTKMAAIRSRHKISLAMDIRKVVYQHDGAWSVASSDGKDLYTVSLQKEVCSCKLICDKCEVCIHRYVCTCLDNMISCNMCKHIHLVSMKMRDTITSCAKPQEPPQDDEPSSMLTIAVDNDSRAREKQNLLAQVCSGKVRDHASALLANKQESAALMNKIMAQVEISACPEEVAALNRHLASALPVMAAVRERSGPLYFTSLPMCANSQDYNL
ncbi:Zinc finger protein [Nesidiocoris tenuis]|uniref:Zinc finger protein n=1 Tax=Nesidiocoris tenuis TaxID=355587 RepID=A0ABN7A875_9HEMI|nr:Zinc finger protein [Nesidiocoris tenuis]